MALYRSLQEAAQFRMLGTVLGTGWPWREANLGKGPGVTRYSFCNT